jgi:hypothetical protein
MDSPPLFPHFPQADVNLVEDFELEMMIVGGPRWGFYEPFKCYCSIYDVYFLLWRFSCEGKIEENLHQEKCSYKQQAERTL